MNDKLYLKPNKTQNLKLLLIDKNMYLIFVNMCENLKILFFQMQRKYMFPILNKMAF